MLLPIKPICERKDMRRDGTSVIYIQYCYSADKRTLLNSEIAIPPEYWNKKRLCISNDVPEIYGNFQVLNSELNRMMRLAEDLIYFAIETKIEDRGKFIKSLLKRTLTLIIFKEMAPQLFLRLAQRTEYKYLLSNR
jgi:hypothetical protein